MKFRGFGNLTVKNGGFDPRLPRTHELEQFTIPSETQEQIVNDHHLKYQKGEK